MVSRSKDGDLIADAVERFGMRAVRGSSGHGGRDALDLMADALDHEAMGATKGVSRKFTKRPIPDVRLSFASPSPP
jgi:lysophospholipid acyltransferase (LPLAT)-like uncharacterized protein